MTTSASTPDAVPAQARPPLEAQRVANREQLRALNIDPYGQRTDGLISLAQAHAAYDPEADAANKASVQARKDAKKSNPDAAETDLPALVDDRAVVRVAGRVVLRRDNGKLVWLNLRDHTRESFQIAVSKRDCDDAGFQTAKIGDLGDLVVAEGPLTMTNSGEVTCWASSVTPASKCLTPPPEKHKGLSDPEIRFRRRYLDLWANPHAARTLVLRSKLVRLIRSYFDQRGFYEMDTPVLQPLAGGAAARPFVTRMNALGIDLYLRIAPELYLKRLMVGGITRVYEISRNFRNEGVDRSHNPEFTSIELYQAYGNYETMAELTEGLVRALAQLAVTERLAADPEDSGVDGAQTTIRFGEYNIDYGSPFVRVTYAELFERGLGYPMTDTARAREDAKARGLKTVGENGTPLDDLLIVNELFEAVAEDSIDPARPTFVFDYPAALSPLTRPKAGTENDPIPLAERWDIFIGGMEIGHAYTELNDPDIQEAKFREQLAGIDDEESTFRTFDQDFIDALKVGMPPAGGLGLGIDRLVMLMTGHDSIREVMPFPLMRPRDVRSIAIELVGQFGSQSDSTSDSKDKDGDTAHATQRGLDVDALIDVIRARGVLSGLTDSQLRSQIEVLVERGELSQENGTGRLSVPGAGDEESAS